MSSGEVSAGVVATVVGDSCASCDEEWESLVMVANGVGLDVLTGVFFVLTINNELQRMLHSLGAAYHLPIYSVWSLRNNMEHCNMRPSDEDNRGT